MLMSITNVSGTLRWTVPMCECVSQAKHQILTRFVFFTATLPSEWCNTFNNMQCYNFTRNGRSSKYHWRQITRYVRRWRSVCELPCQFFGNPYTKGYHHCIDVFVWRNQGHFRASGSRGSSNMHILAICQNGRFGPPHPFVYGQFWTAANRAVSDVCHRLQEQSLQLRPTTNSVHWGFMQNINMQTSASTSLAAW